MVKHVYPVTFKLLDDTKVDVKTAVNKLIQTLYGLANHGFLEEVPPGKLPRVMEAVKE